MVYLRTLKRITSKLPSLANNTKSILLFFLLNNFFHNLMLRNRATTLLGTAANSEVLHCQTSVLTETSVQSRRDSCCPIPVVLISDLWPAFFCPEWQTSVSCHYLGVVTSLYFFFNLIFSADSLLLQTHTLT